MNATVTYTSDVSAMRCIHAYNRAALRSTNVQMRSPHWAGAWDGCTLVSTWGDVWHVVDAAGTPHYVTPDSVRMPQA